MSGIFSKYKKRFVPNKQIDLINTIKSDKQMFQEYQEFFHRKKVDGICTYLCEYVILNDLLVDKESFVKAFDSIKKRRLLMGDLIQKAKSGNIDSDEVNRQKMEQKVNNRLNEAKVFISKVGKKIQAALKKMDKEAQEKFINEVEQISQKEIIESPLLAMKKSKVLTATDLNLTAIKQNSYTKIFYYHMINKEAKESGHAVLIKKNLDNSFAFYDPNYGAVFDLTEEQLCEVVTQSFYDYVKVNKLDVAALFILLTSVIAGIVVVVCGYNIAATLLLMIFLVELPVLYHLKESPQMYNTIVSADNGADFGKSYEIKLENLIDKYCSGNSKIEDVVVASRIQVESANKISQLALK